jgi:hypothetical protein
LTCDGANRHSNAFAYFFTEIDRFEIETSWAARIEIAALYPTAREAVKAEYS